MNPVIRVEKKNGIETWTSEKKVASIVNEKMQNGRHPHIKMMMKLKTYISDIYYSVGVRKKYFLRMSRGRLI